MMRYLTVSPWAEYALVPNKYLFRHLKATRNCEPMKGGGGGGKAFPACPENFAVFADDPCIAFISILLCALITVVYYISRQQI
jgi:hypothetical protein